MSSILDDGVDKSNVNAILIYGAIMLGVSVVNLLFTFGIVKINAFLTTEFTSGLRRKLFSKVHELSMEQFYKVGNASLITRTTEDIYMMQDAVFMILSVLITAPIIMVGSAILAFLKDVYLSLIILSALPVALIAIIVISKIAAPLIERSRKAIDKLNLTLRERLVGLRVIRAFNKEEYEKSRFRHYGRQFYLNVIRSNSLIGAMFPFLVFLMYVLIVVLIYVGAIRMDAGAKINTSDIVAIIQYIMLMMMAVINSAWFITSIPRMNICARRINELLDMKAILHESENPIEDLKITGDLEIKDMTFFYDDKAEKPSLENINMTMKPGQVVSILGGTGSGKSTIAKLLLKFYDATSGTITLDGKPLRDISTKLVRDNIGYVAQKSTIFSGSYARNIRLGRIDATDEQVREAAEVAQLSKFISSLEKGYDSPIEESGANMSGGQKQRLSIARAIVKKAPIYIFDDSFSALDFQTDANIRRALKTYLKDSLIIIITQRVGTAMNSDMIYVLDNGALVGGGKHKELISDCEVYRELAILQLGVEGI